MIQVWLFSLTSLGLFYVSPNSGTPLFTSIRPGVLTPDQEEEVRQAFALASQHTCAEALPLDWQNNTCPESWLLSHQKRSFSWFPAQGALDLTT